MNRKTILGLLVSCLLISLATGLGFAQETAQKPAKKSAPPVAWTTLPNGVQVLRVPQPKGYTYPEVRSVVVSTTEFAKFEANPKDYVNDLGLFPHKVKQVFILHMPPADGSKSTGDMGLGCVHDVGSTVTCVTSPATQ